MIRLALIALVVPDYDQAIAHYCDDLGFTLIKDEPQGAKRWPVVGAPNGGSEILLAKADRRDQAARIGNQTGGRVSFFLETDDFGRDFKAFSEKDVSFEEAPRTEPYGTVAVFRDFFGNRWDLIQPA